MDFWLIAFGWREVNILYTVNNDFMPQLAAGICSICENNKDANHVDFYVFGDGIASDNKEILSRFVAGYGRHIHFIDIDGSMVAASFGVDTGAWNGIVMARLLIARLLPQDIDKVLYLDGDTIVRGSLLDLWDNNPAEGVLSMVMEPTASRLRRKELGIEQFPYFNAGVLLVDLKKWRENDAETRILDYCTKNGSCLFANDQDAINVVLSEEIDAIPPKYNASNVFSYYPYSFLHRLMPQFSSEKEYMDAREDPVIVHYLGEERPWRKGNTHVYRREYSKYLSMTPFADTALEAGWEMYFVLWRLFNVATKHFPSLRYKVIDCLIPSFLKLKSRAK